MGRAGDFFFAAIATLLVGTCSFTTTQPSAFMFASAAVPPQNCSHYDDNPQQCLHLYTMFNATCGYSHISRRCVNCSQLSAATCKESNQNRTNIVNGTTIAPTESVADACVYNAAINECTGTGYQCGNYTASACMAPYTTEAPTLGQCVWNGLSCQSCSSLNVSSCARPRCTVFNHMCMSTTSLCYVGFSNNQSSCDNTPGCYYDVTLRACMACGMYNSKALCDTVAPSHSCRWNSQSNVCGSTTECTTYSLVTCPADHCVVDDSSECDNPARLCSQISNQQICRSYSDRFQCSWINNTCTTCLQLPNTSCANLRDCQWHSTLRLCLPFSSGGASSSGDPNVVVDDVKVDQSPSTGVIIGITIACVFAVFLCCAIGVWLRSRVRQQKLRESELRQASEGYNMSATALPGQSAKSNIDILLPTGPQIPPRGTSELALRAPSLFQEGQVQRLKLLGRGANGSVYSCMLPDGTLIAMKEILLPHGQAENEEFVNCIMNEVAIVCSLEHTNVVRYFGSALEKEEHRLTIFLEMVPHGSLASMVRSMQEPMKEDVARVYVRQLVSALDYIHGKGVVHRDLKCDNLLLTSEGWIKLTDFGASKIVGVDSMATHAAQTMVGTPFFMAPEILMGGEEGGLDAGYGRRADIWSLGITVLEMMQCGKVPWPEFPSAGAALMYIAAQEASPIIPETLSDNAKDFIRKCCHREPMQRLTAAELALHPWLRSGASALASSCEGSTDDNGETPLVVDSDDHEAASALELL